MAPLIWRRWAASCLLAGTIIAPLFFAVFTGGTFLRFFALPLRYAWAWWLCRPILRDAWLPPRAVAIGLGVVCGLLSAVTLGNLLGFYSLHPGWFLTLEWWQRPIYPWLVPLPRWFYGLRPGYLWIAAFWTLMEGLAVSAMLWRWRPAVSE